jgi:glycosyltransferase involved in cell wall biosynthesis
MKQNKPATLSVTLAVYNEQENIEMCLKAIKSIADEIIVVDGNSTDKTVAIAKKMGARIISTTNKPNFHINKAMGNDAAKGDWILQLDADEEVGKGLLSEIKQLLSGTSFGYDSYVSPLKQLLGMRPRKLDTPASAYYLPRSNYFLGRFLKNTGQFPDPVIRLFKRGEAYLPAKDVHEQMVVNGKIGYLKSPLLHWATPKFSRYLLRENRYSSLFATQLKEKGIRITPINTIYYLFLKPVFVFCSLFLRYRGFLDGFPGFVFSLFSGIHFSLSYIKLWQLFENEKN